MAIRQSPIPWTKYKKAARTLKTIYPGITPQQIIGRIGFPTKNGKRIRITSDGQGGIKERPLTAKAAQERLRQKRRRIQTGKLSPEDAAESRRIKDERGEYEADHFNELSFIGEQLEDLERRGGDVNAALARLREAGYKFGDEPGNLQYLTPADNKLKNQESRRLQRYLGSREALGMSPSARRPDLITVGEDLSIRRTAKQGKPPKRAKTTASSPEKPETGTRGFSVPELGIQAYVTPPQSSEDLSIPVMSANDALKIVAGAGATLLQGAGTLAGSYMLR